MYMRKLTQPQWVTMIILLQAFPMSIFRLFHCCLTEFRVLSGCCGPIWNNGDSYIIWLWETHTVCWNGLSLWLSSLKKQWLHHFCPPTQQHCLFVFVSKLLHTPFCVKKHAVCGTKHVIIISKNFFDVNKKEAFDTRNIGNKTIKLHLEPSIFI